MLEQALNDIPRWCAASPEQLDAPISNLTHIRVATVGRCPKKLIRKLILERSGIGMGSWRGYSSIKLSHGRSAHGGARASNS